MDVEIADDDRARAACKRLRHEIFVNEQGVSEADESDGLDSECIHVLASSGQVPIGAARFRVIGDTLKIQRVCVSRDFRGKGIGSAIIGFIVAHAKSNRLATFAMLGAQTHAVEFYHRLDFEVVGDEYLDAGIPHRGMRLKL